jgi:hypothetical protein
MNPTLVSLTAWSVTGVTGLTELHLLTTSSGASEPPQRKYSGLPHLRELMLYGFSCHDPWLLEHKEVLQGYGPASDEEQAPGCLGQLANLRTLDLRNCYKPAVELAALAAATQVTQLHLKLPFELPYNAAPATATARTDHIAAAGAAAVAPDGQPNTRQWLAPVLRMTGLRALTLEAPRSSFLPVGMGGLTQLTRLHVTFSPDTPGVTCAWVCALEQLVNLQVLTVPAVTVACHHRWLTGLTELGVLELVECHLYPSDGTWQQDVVYNLDAAAGHL